MMIVCLRSSQTNLTLLRAGTLQIRVVEDARAAFPGDTVLGIIGVSGSPIGSYFSAQFLLLWLLINLTADFMIMLPTLRRSFVERDGGSPPTAELSAHLGSQDRNEQPGPLALVRLSESKHLSQP
jgi:hypothetical protein